uniref:Bone morphogenetic protein 15 n=1 Tax=Myripristis murdjan TaxID=586833 RepID=A0A667Y8A0_9TELE
MRFPRATRSVPPACVLPCFVFLLCCTLGHTMTAPRQPWLKQRSRRSPHTEYTGAHHRPLTEEQKADQNLQFMLSLYRSAAEPDGRLKQLRKFGSNTVRLLKPAASSVSYLSASRDHHYKFTVQYNLDGLPFEQLIRASFIHLRSSSSSSTPSSADETLQPPHCWAQVTSLGRESQTSPLPRRLVSLEPDDQWTETDITADVSRHVLQRKNQGRAAKKRQRGESLVSHLEIPSLLLYLEEEKKTKDWMEDLLGSEVKYDPWRRGPPHPSLDAIKNAPNSSTSVPKNRCKLHSFRLSFDELGWSHYFIAPPMYNPRFCQGDCPRILHYGYHSPNHAIIQTVINDMGVGDVPPPSCVPYKYMPMSVLVVHKNKVEYRELEDMVADSCTCR